MNIKGGTSKLITITALSMLLMISMVATFTNVSSAEVTTLPFIWVPNEEDTVSKVDTMTGKELGRYRTGPVGFDGEPSRTTVDLQGNCWVANRYAGTVIKIGLYEAGQYIDRNGNSIIETSRDTNGDGDITGSEILPFGQDECVLWEVVVIPGSEGTYVPGTYPGPYTHDSWNPGPRSIAVDANNNVWVGAYGSMKFYYIDGAAGTILRTVDVSPWNHHAYGAVIDRNGILWSSSQSYNHILRLDPSTDPPTISRLEMGHFVYGLGLDYIDHLFASGWTDSKLSRVNILTGTKDWTYSKPETNSARGVVCTGDNNVWVANSNLNTVTRYDNDGNLLATISGLNLPTGVAVDAAGKVWVTDFNSEYIHRIDPATNTIDLSKKIIGSGGHYGYSDMTGIVSRIITKPPYDVTIGAYCNTEGVDVSVSILMDGNPTGYNTPHTFTGLLGAHTFTVPNNDPNSHSFKKWSTGITSTTITLSSGTYTAYYEATPLYDVTIGAYCNTEGVDVSVSILMDGNPTGYNTPHTFTGLGWTHTFTVPSSDPGGHAFKQWNTGQTSRTIIVSSGGAYTAYYQISRLGHPMMDNKYMKMYGSPDAEWVALKAGEIDIMDWPLSSTNFANWGAGVDIEETKDLGMFAFDINCNATVDGLPGAYYSQPGVPNPTADEKFRLAIARLVDKVEIAKTDFGGFLEVMDVPLASPAHNVYINASTVAEWRTGSMSYNPYAAVTALNAAGYIKGTTTNPYYDPSQTWSSDKIRINPKTGKDLYALLFYIRSDLPELEAAGLRFTDVLRKAGIPVNPQVVGKETCFRQVNYFGYNLYTSYRKLGPDPDHLHDFYTYEFANPWDFNYMIHNAVYYAGVGPEVVNPQLEAQLDLTKYAPTHATLIAAAKKAQGLLFGSKGTIPSIIMGHYAPVWTAYRTGWRGVVNEEGTGVKNWYTEVIAYNPSTGATALKVGLHTTIDRLNPVTAMSDVDWNVLWEIYDPLIRHDPYTLPLDMPLGLAEWWEVGTWNDAGVTKTLLKFRIRDNVKWHDGSPVTAEDVKFSIEYHKAQFGWFYSSVMDVKSVTVDAANNLVTVYMDKLAYLALHWVGGIPILNKAIWQNVPDAYAYDPTTDDANFNGIIDLKEDGTGPYILDSYAVDDYVMLVANRNWYLTTGVDPGDLGDVERMCMEAFHRRGDTDYQGVVKCVDLAMMSRTFSSLPYQSVPTWTDDQYPNLMYSPPQSGDPYITGLTLPFDGGPWKPEDINYDNCVDLTDLATLAKYWSCRAGSGW